MPYIPSPPLPPLDSPQSQGWYQENKFPIVLNDDTDSEAAVPEAARGSPSTLTINSKPRLRGLPPANVKPLKSSLKSREGNLSTPDLYTGHPLLIPFKDPLEILPTELWILCMQFALGDSSVHGPLLYAGISTNWQAKLLETPILWKEICLANGEDEGARVTTFLELSRQTPLTIEILAPIQDLTPLSRVLEHSSRIESLSFNPYHQPLNRQKFVLDAAWKTSLHSMLSLIMRPGIRYDTLKHVDGTGILTISQAMTIIWACPNARFVSSRGENNKRLPTVPSPFKSRPHLEHAIARVLLNASSRGRNVLLTGSPNSGKTSIAAYFMQRYRNLFSLILFVDASSEHNIQVGLISAARQLGLPISSKWDEVLHSLAQQENLLIVYDNVLGLELLEKYLPPHGHSAILATSKDLSKEEKLSYPHFSIIQVGSKLVHFPARDKLENVIDFENTENQDKISGCVEDGEEGYCQHGNESGHPFEDEDRVLFDIDMGQSSTIHIEELSPFSRVHFETLTLTRTRPPSLRGSILVKNIAPEDEKIVMLLLTLDNWETTIEVVCRPVLPSPFPLEHPTLGIPAATWDRFSFLVRLDHAEKKLAEQTIYFSARYRVPGLGEWWDNNDGSNYKLVFKKVSQDNPTAPNEVTKEYPPLQQSEDSNRNRLSPGVRFRSSSDFPDDSLPPLKPGASVMSTVSSVSSASSNSSSPVLSLNSDMSTSTSPPVSATFGQLPDSESSAYPPPTFDGVPMSEIDKLYADLIGKYCFYQAPRQ